MRVLVLAVGRLKRGPERDLCERYRARAEAMARGLGLGAVEVSEVEEARGSRAADRIRDEGTRLLGDARLIGAALVAFDERGRGDVSSQRFAERLRVWRDAARPALALVVGGPDGLDGALRERADLVVAFGALTLPHGLVRVLAMEQLYRAMTILAGHPYHRGDPAGR